MDSTNTATSTDHTSKKHKHKAGGRDQHTKYLLPTKKPMVRHKQVWYQARVLGTTATRVTLGKHGCNSHLVHFTVALTCISSVCPVKPGPLM